MFGCVFVCVTHPGGEGARDSNNADVRKRWHTKTAEPSRFISFVTNRLPACSNISLRKSGRIVSIPKYVLALAGVRYQRLSVYILLTDGGSVSA